MEHLSYAKRISIGRGLTVSPVSDSSRGAHPANINDPDRLRLP